jgi:hypothetical protein
MSGDDFMIFKVFCLLAFLSLSREAMSEANYSLACSTVGNTANVYACNSGNSSEGNNRYVTVRACGDRGCDSDYTLMYIYGASGQCDFVGSISFDEPLEFCTATFRE